MLLYTLLEKKNLSTNNPREVLIEHYLKPMEIAAYKVTKKASYPQNRNNRVLKAKAKRCASADIAIIPPDFPELSSQFRKRLKENVLKWNSLYLQEELQ